MELTLQMSRSDVVRLLRLPLIKAARGGRTRGQPARIVWHDSLDRALSEDGLALAESRGTWRLERHRPAPTEAWPPATDHRLIEEAAELAAFQHALPDALIPVAAFEGRRTVIPLIIVPLAGPPPAGAPPNGAHFADPPLAGTDEPFTLTILDGTLRAVAAERPVTRLLLEGPCAAVRSFASALAEALQSSAGTLSVPEHSLAAEALSLADSVPPPPRRRGAPELPRDCQSVTAAFAHIVGHLTDVMLHLAPLAADAADGVENVHQFRVAVRRARSAFALFPPMTGNPSHPIAAAGLKRLSQILGPARDWDVFMTETAPPVEAVLPDQPDLHAWLRTGERRRRAVRTALGAYLDGPEFRSLMLELSCLAAAEPTPTETEPPTLPEFAVAVLHDRWKKLSKAGKALEELDKPGLHNVRLKAKRLRYAAEFFVPLFPEKPVARFINRLADLQERLGVFNDTYAAETLARELGGKPSYAAGLVLGFTAARGAGVKPKIVRAWTRFRRRDPFWE
jgi:triphosphatase